MSYFRQIYASIVVNFLAACSGCALGSSNLIIPQLLEGRGDEHSYFYMKITKDEASWIATAMVAGMFLTLAFSGPLVITYGRRKSMIVDSVVFLVGFLGQAVGADVYVICAARVILGYAFLSSRAAIQPFVCEISDPKVRGFTTSLWMISFCTGLTCTVMAGSVAPWRWITAGCCAFSLLTTIGLCTIHESPDWLLRNHYWGEAKFAMQYYNPSVPNKNAKIYDDLVKETYKEHKSNVHNAITQNTRMGLSKKLAILMWPLLKSETYKPLFYLIIAFILFEASGFCVVANYTLIIMKEAGITTGDPYIVGGLFHGSRVIFSFLASILMHKFGRRPIFLTMATTLFVSWSSIAGFTYCRYAKILIFEQYKDYPGFDLIPVFLLVLGYFAAQCGYCNVVLALMGELLPPEISGIGNTIIFTFGNIAALLLTKMAPSMLDMIGIHGIFTFFASVVGISLFYHAIFMPETQGLSLKEIREIYQSNTKVDRNEMLVNESA